MTLIFFYPEPPPGKAYHQNQSQGHMTNLQCPAALVKCKVTKPEVKLEVGPQRVPQTRKNVMIFVVNIDNPTTKQLTSHCICAFSLSCSTYYIALVMTEKPDEIAKRGRVESKLKEQPTQEYCAVRPLEIRLIPANNIWLCENYLERSP